MQKKNPDAEDDFEDLDEELFLDDLEDDPLLQEAASILGMPPQKKKSTPKNNTKNQAQETVTQQEKKENSSHGDLKSAVKEKPVINKETMTAFAQYLIKIEKIYEEISFHTILRKIPKQWHFAEEAIIDILEVLIENHTIPTFDMKMTTHSVKFYPVGSKQDIQKKTTK